ncbi:MAG: peptidoglycan-binding protein [Rhodobacteraceae bacterium]|uniref:CsgG/HfaB family protein n=1 Tax=Accumulibacter sp. TaxID=2053492 RepID=UPI0019DF5281|nr:CsgG/HfaB family protein [Accumulibacter sp.]MBE2258097.1 peptidoglycan-binding protein [Paracoccaceae bacterium]MCB1943771.1 peptidoglycan-binding protein [Accumulibacter sp.]
MSFARNSDHTARLVVAAAATALLAGCANMEMGAADAKTTATGSAGGANATNANSQLERCASSLGTIAVVEDTNSPWYGILTRQWNLGSTTPVLKLLIQQSNCFVVVERGRAMNNMMQERALEDSGELRKGSKFHKGQMVSADYSMSPSITFSNNNAGGMGGGLGGINRSLGVLGAIAGSMNVKEASTLLTLVDNRSGVQLAAAEGSAKNVDFGAVGSLFGSSAGGGLGGYSNTAEGKVIVAAFTDSYNNIVRAVKNYKAQEVQGGLGTGGQLGVQGADTAPASKKKSKSRQ